MECNAVGRRNRASADGKKRTQAAIAAAMQHLSVLANTRDFMQAVSASVPRNAVSNRFATLTAFFCIHSGFQCGKNRPNELFAVRSQKDNAQI